MTPANLPPVNRRVQLLDGFRIICALQSQGFALGQFTIQSDCLANSQRASCRSLSAVRTPSLTTRPSRSIVCLFRPIGSPEGFTPSVWMRSVRRAISGVSFGTINMVEVFGGTLAPVKENIPRPACPMPSGSRANRKQLGSPMGPAVTVATSKQ